MIRKKILVIDDEIAVGESVKQVLRKKDYNIITALDGKQGFKQAKTQKPDLILLDIMMPDMDGWEVLRMLQNDDRYESIPIAMLTAKTQAKDKILGIQEGAVDYITKPFAPDELLERIEKIFSHINN